MSKSILRCAVCGNTNQSTIIPTVEGYDKCTCCGESLIEMVDEDFENQNCTGDITEQLMVEAEQSIFY